MKVYKNDQGDPHREDGPAIHSEDMSFYMYCVNGKLHRLDGPAVLRNGEIAYYIRDNMLTEEEFLINPEVIEYNIERNILDLIE